MSSVILLRKLADGHFHSGSDIGKFLGVSRAAVWKQIQKLESEFAIKCDSVKGKGYKIPGGIDFLDKNRIFDALDSNIAAVINEIEIFDIVDSTNDIALARVQRDDTSSYVCFAEMQTAGRGRRGRRWISPFGKNIYLSMLWRFQGGASALEGLSLATGVAVAGVLEKYCAQGIELKWPNDILLDRRKIAGVLLEIRGDALGVCDVVIGVGINVEVDKESAKSIDQSWTDLKSNYTADFDRNQLASDLIIELGQMLLEFTKSGFGAFIERWSRFDGLKNQPVNVFTAKESFNGVACGVSSNGALRLQIGEEIRMFNGGEVSLRLSE